MRSIYTKHPGADSVIRGRHVYGVLKWARGRVHDIKGKRGSVCVCVCGGGLPLGVSGQWVKVGSGGLRRWSAAFKTAFSGGLWSLKIHSFSSGGGALQP